MYAIVNEEGICWTSTDTIAEGITIVRPLVFVDEHDALLLIAARMRDKPQGQVRVAPVKIDRVGKAIEVDLAQPVPSTTSRFDRDVV